MGVVVEDEVMGWRVWKIVGIFMVFWVCVSVCSGRVDWLVGKGCGACEARHASYYGLFVNLCKYIEHD